MPAEVVTTDLLARLRMTRAQPTRTTGPLHFEDLEPHRFEDLVRRLIYSWLARVTKLVGG
jgi:hypothetical protein